MLPLLSCLGRTQRGQPQTDPMLILPFIFIMGGDALYNDFLLAIKSYLIGKAEEITPKS